MNSYITDRTIMQNAEKKVSDLIKLLQSDAEISSQTLISELKETASYIHAVTTSRIEYQVVVDNLEDNIMITDSRQNILYINPAFEHSFGISRETASAWTISDLLASGKYFVRSIVPDVIRLKKRLMRLAFMKDYAKPSVVSGFPIFDSNGEILYIVSSSQSLSSFGDLRDHFNAFISSLSSINQNPSVKVYETSKLISDQEPLIGDSPQMRQIQYMLEKVSGTDAPVLITGESGTGKELVANAVYNSGKRKNKPFIKVNCSSIPATLIESELFGYEKGAFSGASSSGKKGLFEAANEGTILLDEIGDMPLEAQSKLLRVLQNNEVTRVGGTKPIKLNIRVIASTNSDLKQKIREGTFRSDLYYRLHIIPIHIPPLRERQDDIPLLCQHYLDIFSAQYNRSLALTEDNLELLCHYHWPGNIRELRNIMEYLVVCCSDYPYVDNSILHGILDIEELPDETAKAESAAPADSVYPFDEGLTLNEAVARFEKDLLKSTMQSVSGMKEAAKVLGVDISTVSRKLKQYGLSAKGEEPS